MKLVKKIVLLVILAALLLVLIIPKWNPLLNDVSADQVSVQLQETFGNLFNNRDPLTLGRIISAAAVVVGITIVCIVICMLLEWLAQKGKQRRSIASLFSSLTKFLGVIVAFVWALSILGVDLVGIFASLGIASLIVGFGAQSLIEDTITGIFIIFEGQYHVGDIIVLDEFRGTVKHIGIRTTSVQDDGGNIKIVNNSDIRNLQNRSRADSVAVSDLSISYNANIEEVEKIIATELPGMYERHSDVFISAPMYKGIQALGESSVVLRFVVCTKEQNFYAAFRALNRELKLMCDRNGIEIPFNQLVIHQADK
jgi:small conductance mechanosensitive channel